MSLKSSRRIHSRRLLARKSFRYYRRDLTQRQLLSGFNHDGIWSTQRAASCGRTRAVRGPRTACPSRATARPQAAMYMRIPRVPAQVTARVTPSQERIRVRAVTLQTADSYAAKQGSRSRHPQDQIAQSKLIPLRHRRLGTALRVEPSHSARAPPGRGTNRVHAVTTREWSCPTSWTSWRSSGCLVGIGFRAKVTAVSL
jgi:hypothetical protein